MLFERFFWRKGRGSVSVHAFHDTAKTIDDALKKMRKLSL